MSAETLLIILFVGLVAGWLAGQIVQGTGFGLVADIAIGIVGALIGSWLLPALGIHLGAGIVPADGSCGLIAQEEGPSASAGALAFRRASGSRATVARALLCYSFRRSNRTLMERKLGRDFRGRSPDHHPSRRPRWGEKWIRNPKTINLRTST